MKLIFENWNNYLNERRNSSERQFREAVVDFVVGQMRTMGMNAGEASDRARIQKEVHSIVDLAMEQLGLTQEAMYEPGRAVTDVDTGEERMSPEEINDEEVQDLADKFNVEAFVEIASDGRVAIIVKHQDGKVAMYNDTEKMYQDLASRQEMSEGAELKIPVERYDAFKRKIEQWGMLFNKFTGQSQDLGHRDPEVVRAAAPKLLRRVNKLERELMKIMGEFDLNYKSYDDERHAMRQKLDRFDGDSEFFLEEEK